MSARELPKPAAPDRTRRVKVATYDGFQQRIVLPSWGYLQGVELRTRELIPNMDAGAPYAFDVHFAQVFADHFPTMPFDVFAVVRDVLDYGEPDPYSPPPLPGESTLTCPHCDQLLRLRTEAS